MKKRILGGIAVLAVAAAMALNVNLSTKSNDLSDISLANVEALAKGEEGGSTDCPGGTILCAWITGCSDCPVTYYKK